MKNLLLLDRNNIQLTQKAAPVLDFKNPELQAFIDDLIQCGDDNDGVGIAAPQVGNSWRLFIMAPRPNPRYPDAPLMEATAIINPEILSASSETEKGWEGCLSVPGFRGLVPRSIAIEVTFLDRTGLRQNRKLTGFLARLFQHEFDHLEGILYPDRMDKKDALVSLEEYTAITGIVVK